MTELVTHPPEHASYEALQKSNRLLLHEVKNLREDVAYLEEQVRHLKRLHFSSSSEVCPSGQKTLFNEAETIAATEPSQEETAASAAKKPKVRGRPVRKPLPKHLPRVVKIIDLPESEKVCPHGTLYAKIGEEVSEQLDIEPARATVVEIHRLKYKCDCPQCNALSEPGQDERSATIHTAPQEPHLIPKSMATPSLLAYIAVGKYADALPLYRQTDIFGRNGIDISRATMAAWMIRCGEALVPIINEAWKELLRERVILVDETPHQILRRNGKTATSTSYMWAFRGGGRDGPTIVIFESGPSRAHTVPLQFLLNYDGFVLTDGFEAYDTLARKCAKLTLAADWVHVRRRFHDAVEAVAKDFKGEIKAKRGRDLINELFRIEREDIAGADDAVRLEIRQKTSKPIVEELEKWAGEVSPTVPPKSLTGKALSYMKEQWPKLLHFLTHPELRLDTNPVENAIRPFVVGRNNWLFSATEEGADASAVLYSMISMARANGVNPYEYLKAVFERFPHATTSEDFADLLPWRWSKTADRSNPTT